MNLNPRSRTLGVEIQEGAVYAALLCRDRQGWTVAGFASQPLSPLSGEPSTQHIATALQQALRQLSGGYPRRAAFALPETLVAHHQCTLSGDFEEDALETALFAEAEGLLPYPIEELAMDYRFLPGTRTEDGRVTAEIVVCRRRNLEQLQAIAQAAGLQAVCAEPAAAARSRGWQMLEISKDVGNTPTLRVETALAPTPTERHNLSLACGLAVGGGFNLFPWRERGRRAANRNSIAAAAVMVLLAQVPVSTEHRQMQAHIGDWQAQNAALLLQTEALEREAEDLRQEKREIDLLAAGMRTMHGWRQQQHTVLEMLLNLGRDLPPGLRLRQIKLQGRELELEGNALSLEEVNLLLASAEQDRPWQNAHISGIQAAKDSQDLVNFKMRGQLAPPGDKD